MIFFQLLLMEDLGRLSLQEGTRGWFSGRVIESEKLALAFSGQVGDGEPFYAEGSMRLIEHWSFLHGKSVEKFVPWVAVKAGFGVALNAGRKMTKDDLTGWTIDGLPPVLPGDSLMLCCIEPPSGNRAPVHLILVIEDEVYAGQVQTVTAEPQRPARLDGLRPLEALKEKRVAVVGVGSGGSALAVNLAAAGVGTLNLFDKDKLTTDNLFRHACDIRHLGRAKVHAVRDLIKSYDLPANVIPYKQDVIESAEGLWGVMSEVDLILCDTDNVQSRRLVNYIAVHSGTPMVMACTFRNARVGEIIRVLPSETACYECTRLELRDAGAIEPVEEDDELTGTERIPYSLGGVEGAEAAGDTRGTANQGTRSDVTIVAALQSRIAVTTLLANSEEESSARLPTNYLAWGATVETELSNPFRFELPFSTNWVRIERRPDCPICSTPAGSLEAEINEEYEAIMANLA